MRQWGRMFRLGGLAWVLVVLIGALGACATRTGTGAIAGAGAGALVGGLIGEGEGAAIGGLLGAALGAGVGHALDVRDQQRAMQVLETAPTHHTEQWVNPDSGARYEMTPTRTYQSGMGQPCREFSFESYVGGRPQETWGTACRQADGSWRITDSG